MDGQHEIWKPLVGYDNFKYEVSDKGRVRNLKTGKILKGSISNGYRTIFLSNRNQVKLVYAHRLVCLAFVERIEGKNQVNHKNGDTLDNCLENLEWMSAAENIAHSILNNLHCRGETHYRSKLTEENVREILSRKYTAKEKKEIAERFGISIKTLSDVIRRRSWSWLEI